MNGPPLCPPLVGLSRGFEFENGWGGQTRRSFLKRSGGATVATFVAWNGGTQRARANGENEDPSSIAIPIVEYIIKKYPPDAEGFGVYASLPIDAPVHKVMEALREAAFQDARCSVVVHIEDQWKPPYDYLDPPEFYWHPNPPEVDQVAGPFWDMEKKQWYVILREEVGVKGVFAAAG